MQCKYNRDVPLDLFFFFLILNAFGCETVIVERAARRVSVLWFWGLCRFDTVGWLVIIKKVPVMVKQTSKCLFPLCVFTHLCETRLRIYILHFCQPHDSTRAKVRGSPKSGYINRESVWLQWHQQTYNSKQTKTQQNCWRHVSCIIFATVFIFKLTKRGEGVIIIANILLQNIDYYIWLWGR